MLMRPEPAKSVASKDTFVTSLLSRPVWFRLAGIILVILVLWLLIAWAVALP